MRTLRSTFCISQSYRDIGIGSWNESNQTHSQKREKQRMSNLSFQFDWTESEEGLFDHKNSALIDLTRWRSRTEPLLRILFVVFVLAILPRWLRITRNALAERLTNPIQKGEDSLSFSLTRARTILRNDKNIWTWWRREGCYGSIPW